MDFDVTYLSTLFAGLSFYLIYMHFKKYSYWSSKGIKGPTPWPILGTNIYYVFSTKDRVDLEWRKKYGKVIGLYDGYRPRLLVMDNEIASQVFVTKFRDLQDRVTAYIHGDGMKSWLFFATGETWNRLRVLLTPTFTNTKLKSFFPIQIKCIDNLQRHIESKLSDRPEPVKRGAHISKDDLMSLAMDVIGRSFFNIKIDTYQDKTSEFYERAFAFARFDIWYFLIWLMIPNFVCRYFKLNVMQDSKFSYFDALGRKLLDQRRASEAVRKDDFIQALLDARMPKTYENVYTKSDDNEAHYNDNIDHTELERINKEQYESSDSMRPMTDREITGQITFFFIAGFETTSSSISFCFFCLAHYPESQREVYEELVKAKLSPDEDGFRELLSLPKLDAFVSESLRLFAPVTDIERKVQPDNGIELPTNPPIWLPKGTGISVNPFAIHRDPEVWPNPEQFDMSRFYKENMSSIKRGSYMPFGIGPRNCVGMRFALITIKATLASTLTKFKVCPAPMSQSKSPEFNKHSFFLQLKHPDFLLVPRSQS